MILALKILNLSLKNIYTCYKYIQLHCIAHCPPYQSLYNKVFIEFHARLRLDSSYEYVYFYVHMYFLFKYIFMYFYVFSFWQSKHRAKFSNQIFSLS